MHKSIAWLSTVAVLACGCHGNELPIAPTSTPMPAASVAPAPSRDAENWTPFYFSPWQPGRGAPLAMNTTVSATVNADDICVPDIYQQWGARSCSRFVVEVPAEGWLHGLLRWDASAPGFEPDLAGEVVIVASTGRFATSGWKQTAPDVFARVEPGAYDVLVMSYVQTRLPFQLRMELR